MPSTKEFFSLCTFLDRIVFIIPKKLIKILEPPSFETEPTFFPVKNERNADCLEKCFAVVVDAAAAAVVVAVVVVVVVTFNLKMSGRRHRSIC